ncbi:eukaryotic rRNA processing protein EBP2-domain-containing protein [Xylariaceae sp. FL0662B]|nr:eukaryotic rRNA processing protein EBP2-domain-containing protein [Xylariaceae sp. FL0662B]
MGKSKLKLALAAEKEVDFKKLKEKKKHKQRVKHKQQTAGQHRGAAEVDNDGDWEGVDEDEDNADGGAPIAEREDQDNSEDEQGEEERQIDYAAVDDSDSSDSSIELEEKIQRPKSKFNADKAKAIAAVAAPSNKEGDDDDDDEEEEEEEEDIPMSDLEDLPGDEKEDLIPHSRLTINNTTALLASLNRIRIPTDETAAFATHQTVVGAAPTAAGIEDIQDDLKRELAFYAQSLEAARRGRARLRAEGVPFSRPTDYFAEMVKDDGHMEKVKARLVEEASAKRAAAEARKLRDQKKFGKQVQVARLQERQKAKRETLDKIKTLKRKRQESGTGDLGANEADLFDVGVDSELNKAATARRPTSGASANHKRQKKDAKYGFGGKKRYAKSGDAASSADMSAFSARRMKTGAPGKIGKTARLGKSRRNAAAAAAGRR